MSRLQRFFGVAGACVLIAGCSAPEAVAADPVPAVAEQEPAPPQVLEVEPGVPVRRTLTVDSHIATEFEVNLVAQSSGQLLQVPVQRGQTVREGQTLAEFDNHEEKLALNAAEAELKLARQIEKARRKLFDDEVISEEQWEEAAFDLAISEARRELAAYRVQQTTVRAPFAGVILDRMAQPGMYILEAHAVPLFRLSGEGPLEARAYLPEWAPTYLEEGSPVRVFPLLGDAPLEGRLRWLSPVVDPVAGTVEARVRLRPGEQVRRGSSVRMEFNLVSDAGRLSIPLRSLTDRDPRPGERAQVLAVSAEGGFQPREVLLGLVGDTRAEVRQGLQAGDRILANASRGE
jgi:RND family efflux transporter MFP subunit